MRWMPTTGFQTTMRLAGNPELRKNDYGYNVSVPIKKDRLWVWWNQEWDKDIDGGSFAVCVPTAAEQKGDFSAYGANGLSNGNTVGGLDQCAAVPGTTSVAANNGVQTTQVTLDCLRMRAPMLA